MTPRTQQDWQDWICEFDEDFDLSTIAEEPLELARHLRGAPIEVVHFFHELLTTVPLDEEIRIASIPLVASLSFDLEAFQVSPFAPGHA